MPVYFAQATDGGPVKIGYSSDVPARLKQLEARYGQPLALLATLEGGRQEEQGIHERFAAHRLGRTEQFRPVAEIMAFIGRPLLVGADPDAVEAMAPVGGWVTVVIPADAKWIEWLKQGAKHCRTDVSKFVDAAVIRYAKLNGFDEPPPVRVP